MKKTILAALLVAATGFVSAAGTEPCSTCHQDLSILGKAHPPVAGMSMKDCVACHDGMKKAMSTKLHLQHADKAPCESCHALQKEKLIVKPDAKIIGNLTESDWELYRELFEGFADQTNTVKLHMQKGLLCRDCHDTDTPAEMSVVKNAKCESCHGTVDDIAAKTVPEVKEQNPHKSHQGQLNCNKCHSGHGTAKSYCLDCHSNFRQVMPEASDAQ